MKALPDVTLACVDCVDPHGARRVLNHCTKGIGFGDVKLLTNWDVQGAVKIPRLSSLVEYSVWMLTEFYKYIDTPRVLIVQRDGWILNPDRFNDAWLELDYIGPLFVQYDHVGSGGFSLRSRRIMEYASSLLPAWTGDNAEEIQAEVGFYEDGFLCFDTRFAGFRKSTPEQAADFAQGGNRNPAYFRELPFGFHRTWQDIDFATGRVDSTDTTKDLNSWYNLDDCGL